MQEDESILLNDWKRAQHADAGILFVLDRVVTGHRSIVSQGESHGTDKRFPGTGKIM